VEWSDFALALLGMIGSCALVLLAAATTGLHARLGDPALRVGLWSLICGLIGYLLYGLGLPGSDLLEDVTPGLRGLLVGFGFGLLPLLVVAWLSLQRAWRR
jgi:hypothetical protein